MAPKNRKKGGDLIEALRVIEINERPEKEAKKFEGRRKFLKKIVGKKDGGLMEAIDKVKAQEMSGGGEPVPPKFKGFSKLPEKVQEKMNPDLATKFEFGGDVKGKKGRMMCRGMGIARKNKGFKIT